MAATSDRAIEPSHLTTYETNESKSVESSLGPLPSSPLLSPPAAAQSRVRSQQSPGRMERMTEVRCPINHVRSPVHSSLSIGTTYAVKPPVKTGNAAAPSSPLFVRTSANAFDRFVCTGSGLPSFLPASVLRRWATLPRDLQGYLLTTSTPTTSHFLLLRRRRKPHAFQPIPSRRYGAVHLRVTRPQRPAWLRPLLLTPPRLRSDDVCRGPSGLLTRNANSTSSLASL